MLFIHKILTKTFLLHSIRNRTTIKMIHQNIMLQNVASCNSGCKPPSNNTGCKPPKTTFDVQCKIALVSGGSSGLGFFFAKELLKHGLKGVTLADINEETGKIAVKCLNNEFGADRAIFIKTDVAVQKQFEDAFKLTIKTFGQLDILINNAGILNDRIWERQIAININGTIYGTMLALEEYIPKHRSSCEGVIVNLSSITGLDEFGSIPVYAATKHAVLGLSRSFGTPQHYKRTKVKVLTLCPGVTDTPLVDLNSLPNKTLGTDYSKHVGADFNMLEAQSPTCAAEAMVQIIKVGQSGSVWVTEDKEPVWEVDIPKRQCRRKK